MFASSFAKLSLFALALSMPMQAFGHALIEPALGVTGQGARSDVQRPSKKTPCGSVNIADALADTTPVKANGDSFTVSVQNFNAYVRTSVFFLLKSDSLIFPLVAKMVQPRSLPRSSTRLAQASRSRVVRSLSRRTVSSHLRRPVPYRFRVLSRLARSAPVARTAPAASSRSPPPVVSETAS